ncbi:unnamed protein product, partial [Mesorhabditis spiculigera]
MRRSESLSIATLVLTGFRNQVTPAFSAPSQLCPDSHKIMASKDYDKMTVALLREELKARDLAVEGKKAELIERLKEADQAAEDEILNAPLDGVLAAGDINEDLLLASVDATIDGKDASELLGDDKKSADDKEANAAPVKSTKSDEERKLARLGRFGLPISGSAAATSTPAATNTITSTDAKAARAKRFGLENAVASGDAKARRAERFGITATDKLDAPLSKAASAMDDSTKEKLMKRAQRFGLPVNSEGKVTGAPLAELDAKKKARAERFGL